MWYQQHPAEIHFGIDLAHYAITEDLHDDIDDLLQELWLINGLIKEREDKAADSSAKAAENNRYWQKQCCLLWAMLLGAGVTDISEKLGEVTWK